MADELDELFSAHPDGFTARRTELARAAKRRGEPAVAKQISAVRKPTTAAWIVNRLALDDKKLKGRLGDLGHRLRAAHAKLEGDQIRLLSAEQRSLVDELTREAFARAGVSNPSAALRDDVSGTLQAAIADPDVTARLGRLTKAERWSGFAELGEAAMVDSGSRPASASATRKRAADRAPDTAADEDARRRESLRAAVAGARQAVEEADQAVSERQAELATARGRLEEARQRLDDAERAVKLAESAHRKAQQARRDAEAMLKRAKARLSEST